MDTKLALSKYASINANAIGVATLQLGPVANGESWHVNKMTVTSTSSVQPTVKIYRGNVSNAFIDFTLTGQGDVSETDVDVRNLEFLTAQFVGADPGSSCTWLVEGDLILQGRRAY